MTYEEFKQLQFTNEYLAAQHFEKLLRVVRAAQSLRTKGISFSRVEAEALLWVALNKLEGVE